jgi:hypothetical protein
MASSFVILTDTGRNLQSDSQPSRKCYKKKWPHLASLSFLLWFFNAWRYRYGTEGMNFKQIVAIPVCSSQVPVLIILYLYCLKGNFFVLYQIFKYIFAYLAWKLYTTLPVRLPVSQQRQLLRRRLWWWTGLSQPVLLRYRYPPCQCFFLRFYTGTVLNPYGTGTDRAGHVKRYQLQSPIS